MMFYPQVQLKGKGGLALGPKLNELQVKRPITKGLQLRFGG